MGGGGAVPGRGNSRYKDPEAGARQERAWNVPGAAPSLEAGVE